MPVQGQGPFKEWLLSMQRVNDLNEAIRDRGQETLSMPRFCSGIVPLNPLPACPTIQKFLILCRPSNSKYGVVIFLNSLY